MFLNLLQMILTNFACILFAGPSPVKAEKLKITHPKTPQLMTRQRHRPTMMKSSAEIQAEETEKMQQ